MLTSVYRSKIKDQMYLYIAQKDDFSKVPEALLKVFGDPEFSMQLNLKKRDKLARADINEVKQALIEDGFYLQMPPTVIEELKI